MQLSINAAAENFRAQLLFLSSLPSHWTFSNFWEPCFSFLLLCFLIITSFPFVYTCSFLHVLFLPASNCIFHTHSKQWIPSHWLVWDIQTYIHIYQTWLFQLFCLKRPELPCPYTSLSSAKNCITSKTWCQRSQNKPGNNSIHQIYLFSWDANFSLFVTFISELFLNLIST